MAYRGVIFVIAVFVVIITIPGPHIPASRRQVRVHDESTGRLGETLLSNPCHNHVVNLIVHTDLGVLLAMVQTDRRLG